MSDWFYRCVCMACTPPVAISSRPIVLHRDRVPADGPAILASNHCSPYDVPALMRSTPRNLDFLSITEMRRKPLIGPFYAAVNCVFTDRARSDPGAVRAIYRRLQNGRIICMFPEGRLRSGAESVLHGGRFKPGAIRIAQQAGVPIIPCAVMNTGRYARPTSWLPFRRWAYGINYGNPIKVSSAEGGVSEATDELAAAWRSLASELSGALKADTSSR